MFLRASTKHDAILPVVSSETTTSTLVAMMVVGDGEKEKKVKTEKKSKRKKASQQASWRNEPDKFFSTSPSGSGAKKKRNRP